MRQKHLRKRSGLQGFKPSCSLRNTFAIRTLHALTKRQKNGEDMNPTLTLRILMGHSSVAVTENYLHELRTLAKIDH